MQLKALNHAVVMCHCEEVTWFSHALYSAFAEECEIAENEAFFPNIFRVCYSYCLRFWAGTFTKDCSTKHSFK